MTRERFPGRNEDGETKSRMSGTGRKRGWSVENTRHTHAHTTHGHARLRGRKPRSQGTAANGRRWMPQASRHGDFGDRQDHRTLALPLNCRGSRVSLPLTLGCGAIWRRSTARVIAVRPRRRLGRALAPKLPATAVRRPPLGPAPRREGTGRPWSAISWTLLASPVRSAQRPLAGRGS